MNAGRNQQQRKSIVHQTKITATRNHCLCSPSSTILTAGAATLGSGTSSFTIPLLVGVTLSASRTGSGRRGSGRIGLGVGVVVLLHDMELLDDKIPGLGRHFAVVV